MARKRTGVRRGNKGNFHGSRLAFLEGRLAAYAAVKAFPWHIPLSVEPDESNMILDEPESPELEEKRSKVVKKTRQRLKSWYRHRWVSSGRDKRNPWDVLLKTLHEVDAVPPRRIPGWKAFMRTKSDIIAELYHKENPGKTPQQRARDLKTRCTLARRLWDELTEAERKSFEESTTAEYEEELAAFKEKKDLVNGAIVPTREKQLEARENITAAVSPLLDLIANYTGTCVSLFLGSPPTDDNKMFYLKGINCGTTADTKLTWSEYDKESFHAAMKIFSSFVLKTDPMSKVSDEELAAAGGADVEEFMEIDDSDDSNDPDSSDSSDSSDSDSESSASDSSEDEEPLRVVQAKKKTGRTSKQRAKPQAKSKNAKSNGKAGAKAKAKPKTAGKKKTKPSTPTTPTMDDLRLGRELQEELRQLGPRARAKQMKILAGSSEWERDRESNLARNRALWKRIDNGETI
ncbi:hypothetical protein EIP86_010682, partial [Pleurotus ostreatoroseus]